MRYSDSKEKSAEYLRQALPLMTRQTAALHPVSYAVWYEYVAGINGALKERLDRLQAEGQLLDEAQTGALFRQYIAEVDEVAAQRVAQGFQKVLGDVSRSVSHADDEAGRFSLSLEQWSGDLSESQAASREQLLQQTRQMQAAMAELKADLKASRAEVDRLQEEVTRARQESMSDGLTGLINRRGFDRALTACLGDADKGELSLVIADIDHFKRINDTYGHLFGDRVIRAVADILKANLKGKDLAARYGGEEFAILLPDTNLLGAQAVAEKIRGTVAATRIRRLHDDETLCNVTVSVGVCTYQTGETASHFISRADRALYAAKEQGRNRVSVAA